MSAAVQAAVGAEIRRRRHGMGMTREQLGAAAHVAPNHLGKIEMGRIDPGLTILRRIAIGLRIPVGELLPDHTGLSLAGATVGRLFDGVDNEQVKEGVLLILRATAAQRRDR